MVIQSDDILLERHLGLLSKAVVLKSKSLGKISSLQLWSVSVVRL